MKGAENLRAPICVPTQHVVYVFAGASRRNKVADWLHRREADVCMEFVCRECDIARDTKMGMFKMDISTQISQRIGDGVFCVILSPPCSPWSRIRCACRRRPRPIRDVAHPLGEA